MTSGGIATEKKLAANLHHCKGDGAAVGRAAASSQLVENDKGTTLELKLKPEFGGSIYRQVAWRRIEAVSSISTMKVLWPSMILSLAPTRVNTRSTTDNLQPRQHVCQRHDSC